RDFLVGLQQRKFDAHSCSPSRTTVHRHVSVGAIENAQAFGDVVHADAFGVSSSTIAVAHVVAPLAKVRIGHQHAGAVILNFKNQAMLRLQAAAQGDLSPVNLRRESVFDGVLHQRLQHHAGDNHLQAERIEVFYNPQLFGAEASDFDVKIIVDELHFLPQHYKGIVFSEQRAQDAGQLDDEIARLLGPHTHQRRYGIQRIEQEVRIDLAL